MKARERRAVLVDELTRRTVRGADRGRIQRSIPRGDVVCWDLVPEPSAVPRARAQVRAQLRAWGVEKVSDPVELLACELVTNAIVHGAGRVGLRLARGATLLCEVGDDESAPPLLRDVNDTDESGRGLLLVSNLALRWGTRRTRDGKVVWFEHSLP